MKILKLAFNPAPTAIIRMSLLNNVSDVILLVKHVML